MENNYPASLPEYKPIMEHKNNVFVYQEITPQDFSVYSLDKNGKYYIANVRGEANAKLIVKAVNNYDKLIEALKECKDYFDYMGGNNHAASRGARNKIEEIFKAEIDPENDGIELKDNEFLHNGNKYSVWIQDGFNASQVVHVYKNDEMKMPVVGTKFGPMVSFKDVIMEWAKNIIAKNF